MTARAQSRPDPCCPATARKLAIRVRQEPEAMDALIAPLLDALEGRVDAGVIGSDPPRPISDLADLELRLRDPHFELVAGAAGVASRRPVAEATLAFYPPAAAEPEIESPPFALSAPLGRIEADDSSYYLERYPITPFGVFKERARGIEGRLPEWGEALWETLDPEPSGHSAPVFNPLGCSWSAAVRDSPQRKYSKNVPPRSRARISLNRIGGPEVTVSTAARTGSRPGASDPLLPHLPEGGRP